MYKYDISTDTWTNSMNLNQAKWGLSSCVLDSLIICVGGITGPTDSGQKTIEILIYEDEYIVQTDEMINARSVCSVCQVNGEIYVFGGNVSGDPYYVGGNSVEKGIVSR